LPVPGVSSWIAGWSVDWPLVPLPVESSGPTAEGRSDEGGGLKGSVCTPPAAESGAPIWSAAAGNARTANEAARMSVLRITSM
jgi:hypothetical protein